MTSMEAAPRLMTGRRVATAIVIWLAVVYVAAAQIGLYYEALAVLYTVPVFGLIAAYSLTHRSRTTAALAGAALVVAILLVGLAVVIPKGSGA